MKKDMQEIIKQLRKLLADLEDKAETEKKLCVSFEPTIYPTPLASPEMHCEVRLKVGDKTYPLVDAHITKKNGRYVSILVKAYDPFIHSLPAFVDWNHRKFDLPLKDIKFTASVETDPPPERKEYFSASFHAVYDDPNKGDTKKIPLCDVDIYLPHDNIVAIDINTSTASTSRSIDLGDIPNEE